MFNGTYERIKIFCDTLPLSSIDGGGEPHVQSYARGRRKRVCHVVCQAQMDWVAFQESRLFDAFAALYSDVCYYTRIILGYN